MCEFLEAILAAVQEVAQLEAELSQVEAERESARAALSKAGEKTGTVRPESPNPGEGRGRAQRL